MTLFKAIMYQFKLGIHYEKNEKTTIFEFT
jgi:hypothetical protein